MSDSTETPSAPRDPLADYGRRQIFGRRKRRTLAFLLLYAALVGVVSAWMPPADDGSAPNLALALPMLIAANVWCYADAHEREQPLGKLTRVGLVFVFALAFPIYILRTRGLAGLLTLIRTGLFVMALLACGYIAEVVTVQLTALAGVNV